MDIGTSEHMRPLNASLSRSGKSSIAILHIVSIGGAWSNINTLDELVAMARKQPGKLNLAPTPGTTEITFDHFLHTANITMTKIPYSDVTKALADLAENRVQVMVSGIAIVKSQVDAGKVKLLAITNRKRAAAVPDLPTAIEAG